MQSIQYPLGYLPDKNQFFDDGECKGPEYHWISVYLVSSLIVGLGLSLCLFVFVSTSSNLLKDVITTRIREKLDYSVDPCEDFYKFVCNTFRGHNEFSQAQDSVRLFTLMRLIVPLIPESNQNSWQKAAGMYHACLNFVSSYEPETQYLANWMRSQNLDFLNQTKLATVNPVDMMVRGSIDLGVKLDFSKEQKKWGDEEHSLQNYVKLFMLFGASPPHDQELASRMKEYEETLSAILKNTLDFNKTMDFIRINELGKQTAPYVTSGVNDGETSELGPHAAAVPLQPPAGIMSALPRSFTARFCLVRSHIHGRWMKKRTGTACRGEQLSMGERESAVGSVAAAAAQRGGDR
ncbi:hypothetical protein HPB51_026531 [Rhipicephalus microplus]|uniref:Peptidase M13 N-terminal domain-containing protein n=1 Tax=Rhipicephalus microplus TaxID=6941 RepID=A0A9J6D2C2_RHIMP|nr:hypothetical protein HPB51_026531 [Rhipicephalus microplus]